MNIYEAGVRSFVFAFLAKDTVIEHSIHLFSQANLRDASVTTLYAEEDDVRVVSGP